ncbi:MAG: YihY/virulence factor BrkB family protein [Bacteroidales bacterium]|nr:YihY/virulence factor BrkB family protein [Bacteroidales bacterium]
MKTFNTLRKFLKKKYNFLATIAKKIYLPGFEGIPLYDVIVFFFRGIRKSSLISRANSLSFTFLLAIFPAILFFFTLIPYIPVENLHTTIMETIKNALPGSTYNTVKDTIEDILNHHNSGLLSFGFIFALFFSTSGMIGIMKAFNRSSHTLETRSNFKLYLISILLVFIISFIFLLAMIFLIITPIVLNYLVFNDILRSEFTYYLIMAGKWVIILIMIFTAISFIYYLAPAKKRYFRFISAGSTLATILSLIFIFGFNFYINDFSRYNEFYGSIGTLIILMLWVNLNAIVLLIGFELNASIYDAKKIKARKK